MMGTEINIGIIGLVLWSYGVRLRIGTGSDIRMMGLALWGRGPKGGS